MQNFIQPGAVLTVTAPADVLSGDLVIVGNMFGIAASNAASGDDVEIKIGGVYDLTKSSAQAWTQGAKIYWDATNKGATTTASGNTYIGVAALVAANPSDIGRVRLNMSF
ncbi:Predicted phage recombinase, RecA/RadA family [Faunimonas pinastri]|uniref:Predicted phage recombinase, RecA/RadA family n=1 Tax=Faunimonas pinastri TaxID=1855383 RepID=A0A1H9GFF3_9HYPH|nr:DUF2190 family protein [Faunimonas pinastri]SEQ48773.1 Predicted phage recombinase, RecA/RadA family [Faunimonas pinastri]